MLRSLDISNKCVISRFLTHKPFILTHSVTAKCNCRCQICNIWRRQSPSSEMTTYEIRRMLYEAKKLNFVAYTVWGGEPLLRPDIMDILRYSHKLGLYTSLITNGTLLPKRAKEMAEVVDLTWVSLDCDSDYHDEMRGQKGVFDKAVYGLTKLRDAGGRIAINCVLSKLNMNAVGKMAKFARDLGVLLAFDPMETFPECNEDYALSTDDCTHLFSEIRGFKERGYPILNSFEFIDRFANPAEYSCAQPKVFIVISEDGQVKPFWCRKTDRVLGDLRTQSLGEILYSSSYTEFADITKGCSLCSNSTTVETSVFYSVKRVLMNLYSLKSPYIRFILDFAVNPRWQRTKLLT